MLVSNGRETRGAIRTLAKALRAVALVAFATPNATHPAYGSQLVALDQNTCLHWAETAAQEFLVPVALMKAIATIESGRRSETSRDPWPWTVHFNGRGYWYSSASEARSFVIALLERGHRNIDVGCFQVNVKWHGSRFASVSEMFDPSANARYAARFLQELHQELGSWEAAAAAYHSRTPEHAKRYRDLLQPVLARFGGLEASPGGRPNASERGALPEGRGLTTARRSTWGDETGEHALASLVPLGFHAAADPLF